MHNSFMILCLTFLLVNTVQGRVNVNDLTILAPDSNRKSESVSSARNRHEEEDKGETEPPLQIEGEPSISTEEQKEVEEFDSQYLPDVEAPLSSEAPSSEEAISPLPEEEPVKESPTMPTPVEDKEDEQTTTTVKEKDPSVEKRYIYRSHETGYAGEQTVVLHNRQEEERVVEAESFESSGHSHTGWIVFTLFTVVVISAVGGYFGFKTWQRVQLNRYRGWRPYDVEMIEFD